MMDNRSKSKQRDRIFRAALVASLSFLPVIVSGSISSALSQEPSSATQPNLRSYIGLTYRTLPKGFKDDGGWVVKGGRYRADIVQRGNTRMVWLTRVLRWRQGGPVLVQVVDVIELPTFPRSQKLHYAFCTFNGESDREIFAIAEATDEDIRTHIRQAWRANTKTEKFESISAEGVACERF